MVGLPIGLEVHSDDLFPYALQVDQVYDRLVVQFEKIGLVFLGVDALAVAEERQVFQGDVTFFGDDLPEGGALDGAGESGYDCHLFVVAQVHLHGVVGGRGLLLLDGALGGVH